MKRIKKIFYVAAILLMFLAACSTTKIQSSWKDDNYKGSPFRKVLIIGVFKNETNKRIFEDEFVKQFNDRGIDAVTSSQIIPGIETTDKEVIVAKIRENDIDAVIIARKIGEKKEYSIEHDAEVRGRRWEPYGMGRPGHGEAFFNDYRQIYGQVHSSTYIREDYTVSVETKLYEVKDKKMIWTAVSDTAVVDNVNKLIKAAINTLMKELYDTKLFE